MLAARQSRGRLIAPTGEFREEIKYLIEIGLAGAFARVGTDQQIVLHAERAEHAVALQHLDESGGDQRTRAGRGDVLAVEADLTGALG